MLEACSFASSFLASILGSLWAAHSVLAPVGLSPWDTLAPVAVSAFPRNHGTGFFINARGDLLTAYHVAGHCEHVAVELPDGIRVGRPIAGSEPDDIAVIRLDMPHSSHAVVGDPGSPITGAYVRVVGTDRCGGLASRFSASAAGTIAPKTSADTLRIRSSRPVVSGNSGSPVVDANGRLVGMLRARDASEENRGFAVSAPVIAKVLRSADIPFETSASGPPLARRPLADARDYTFPVSCF